MPNMKDLLNDMKAKEKTTKTKVTMTQEAQDVEETQGTSEIEPITEEERTLRQLFGEVDETMQEIDAKLVGIQYADKISDLPLEDKKWAILSIEYKPKALPGLNLPVQKGTISLNAMKDTTPELPWDTKHVYEVDEGRLEKLNQLIAYTFHDVDEDIVDFDSMFEILSEKFEDGEKIDKKIYVSSFVDKNKPGSVRTFFTLINRHKAQKEFIETKPITRDVFRFVSLNTIDEDKNVVPVVIDEIRNNDYSGVDKNGEPFQYGQIEIIFHLDGDSLSDCEGYEKYKDCHYMTKYKYLDENKQISYYDLIKQINTVSLLLGLPQYNDISKAIQKLESTTDLKAKMEFSESTATYKYGTLKGKKVYYAKLI